MALKLADRVLETTTTVGTGALALLGTVTGYRPISSVCADGDTCYYGLQQVDSNGKPTANWEVGLGTYASATNTLTRTTVLSSSNAGALVNLTAGTTQVWIDMPAALSSAPDRLSLKNFGAVCDGVTDDTAAFTAAINAALALYPKEIEIPAGVCLINGALPVITRPIGIYGAGKRASIIQFGTGVAGNCLTFQNVGFNNEATDFPQTGSTAWTALSSVKAGLVLRDFSVQGNRSAASQQHGLVFQGNCDHVTAEDLEVLYFRGRGIWIGQQYGTGSSALRGYMRESYFNNIKLRHCGDTDGTASFGLYLNDSPGGSQDSSNLNTFENIDVIFSYGKGLEVADVRTTNDGTQMYGLRFNHIVLHERYSGITAATGRLLSIAGAVVGSTFDVNFAFTANNDYCVELLPNANGLTIPPYDNGFEFLMPNVHKGVWIASAGSGTTFKFRSFYGTGEAMATSVTTPGGWAIDCETDNVFQPITSSLTLNGTAAVTVALGTLNGTSGLGAFFPIVNANGTGDTLRCAIFGIKGTLTRAGSTTAGTDTYTFTPDASSTAYIPASTRFSKFVFSSSQWGALKGRYNYIPANRYGTSVNSNYASGQLLQMWPWQFHVEQATSLVRASYGAPTADNSGTPLAVWNNAYVGTSATPSVAGVSKLAANYTSATTLTNFVGGVDGQSIEVVAYNGNCTIASNANIKTATGANIVMTANQALTFTYDATLGYWCGGVGASRPGQSVTPYQYGAKGDGVTDDSAAIVSASATGLYVEFDGTFLVNTNISPASMLWYSKSGGVITIASGATISATSCPVDLSGITFNGSMTLPQYTPAITGANVVTAFGSMTYLNAAGTSYAGADFTHTLSGNQLTLSLASLAATNRSVVSGKIAVNSSNRYVVHVLPGILAQTGNFSGVQINTYDASGTLLGTYDPSASTESLALTGASQIAIQINLQNSANTSATNGSTVINLDHIAFFQLVNDAATASLSVNTGGYAVGILSCTSPRVVNCRFNYHPRAALYFGTCTSAFVEGNAITRAWQGITCDYGTGNVFRRNTIDVSQLSTDGNTYNLKFIRHRCVSVDQSNSCQVIGNVLLGANWGVEAVPQTGFETIIADNVIRAEVVGISVHDGLNSRVANNTIDLAPGWQLTGVEIPGVHVNVNVVGNTINVPDGLSMSARAISASIYATTWTGGTISHNKLAANTPIYISGSSDVASTIAINSNTLEYSATGMYVQFIGANITGNTLRRVGDAFVTYVPNAAVAAYTTGSQLLTITDNVIDSGPEGVFNLTNNTNVVKDNVSNLLSTLPVAVHSIATGSQYFARNVFTGIAPTAYFSGSGSPSRSKDNRHLDGTPILLGISDEQLFYSVATTGAGSPAVHTATATLPASLYTSSGVGAVSYLISVQFHLGGDANHAMLATFVLTCAVGSSYTANGMAQLGSTVVSTGSALVGSGTVTASFAAATNVLTVVSTQTSGTAAGSAGVTNITVRQLSLP